MKANVYYNQQLAGYLEKNETEYVFWYAPAYLQSGGMAISFSFPNTKESYNSVVLFPFFSGLLAEGINKEIQCKAWKIDENDDFLRLLKTATSDTIGAITVKEI